MNNITDHRHCPPKDSPRCKECEQDLTGKIQCYDKGKVYCEICNVRVGKGEEVPRRKDRVDV